MAEGFQGRARVPRVRGCSRGKGKETEARKGKGKRKNAASAGPRLESVASEAEDDRGRNIAPVRKNACVQHRA